MLGAAVLSCVGTHPLGILGRVVDGAWGSHEGRWGPHGVEHVWSETCRKKSWQLEAKQQKTRCVCVVLSQSADSTAGWQLCLTKVHISHLPQLLPLFPVQLGQSLPNTRPYSQIKAGEGTGQVSVTPI